MFAKTALERVDDTVDYIDTNAVVPNRYSHQAKAVVEMFLNSQHPNLGGAAFDASTNWNVEKKKIEDYPRFFLTAAINGCSVFVTGNDREPTVFHGGKSGTVEGGAICH